MKSALKTTVAAILVLAFFCPYPAQAAPNATFEQLKSLVGHWQESKPTDAKANMDIELTANGSAILERFHMIEGGKAIEMTSLYYVDGDQLKMTHYCMAGNQPTFRATPSPDGKTLTFDFESASNLKSANDGHMHHAVFTFIDANTLQTRWTFRKDQKDAFTEDVTYIRSK